MKQCSHAEGISGSADILLEFPHHLPSESVSNTSPIHHTTSMMNSSSIIDNLNNFVNLQSFSM